jgi:hypothetical protein
VAAPYASPSRSARVGGIPELTFRADQSVGAGFAELGIRGAASHRRARLVAPFPVRRRHPTESRSSDGEGLRLPRTWAMRFPVCSHRTRSCVALSHVPPEVSNSLGSSLSEDLLWPVVTPCSVGGSAANQRGFPACGPNHQNSGVFRPCAAPGSVGSLLGTQYACEVICVPPVTGKDGSQRYRAGEAGVCASPRMLAERGHRSGSLFLPSWACVGRES